MIYCINLLVWDLKNCSHESQEISSAFYDNGILKATEGHRTYTKWPLKQWPKLETYASRRLPIGFEVVRLFGCSLPYKSVTHWLHMLMTAYIYTDTQTQICTHGCNIFWCQQHKNKAIIGCLLPIYVISDLNNNTEDCLHLF